MSYLIEDGKYGFQSIYLFWDVSNLLEGRIGLMYFAKEELGWALSFWVLTLVKWNYEGFDEVLIFKAMKEPEGDSPPK